jgi:hypothetical protein
MSSLGQVLCAYSTAAPRTYNHYVGLYDLCITIHPTPSSFETARPKLLKLVLEW